MSEIKDLESILGKFSNEELVGYLGKRLESGIIISDDLHAKIQDLAARANELKEKQVQEPAQAIAALEHTVQATSESEFKAQTLENAGESQLNVEDFVRAVVGKQVYAKLPPGVKVCGEELMFTYDFTFGISGSTEDMSTYDTRARPFPQIYPKRAEVPELVNSHIAAVYQGQNPENRIMSINFFQDGKSYGSGGTWGPAFVMFEMPKEVMDRFVERIKESPDSLEDFYQKTFVGLDSDGISKGMRRARADGFYLIEESKMEEVTAIREKERNSSIHMTIPFFQKLKKYKYQNGPYGQGEPYTGANAERRLR